MYCSLDLIQVLQQFPAPPIPWQCPPKLSAFHRIPSAPLCNHGPYAILPVPLHPPVPVKSPVLSCCAVSRQQSQSLCSPQSLCNPQSPKSLYGPSPLCSSQPPRVPIQSQSPVPVRSPVPCAVPSPWAVSRRSQKSMLAAHAEAILIPVFSRCLISQGLSRNLRLLAEPAKHKNNKFGRGTLQTGTQHMSLCDSADHVTQYACTKCDGQHFSPYELENCDLVVSRVKL